MQIKIVIAKNNNFKKKGNVDNEIGFTIDNFIIPIHLCEDAQRALRLPNAGGSSRVSEGLSVDYMHRNLRARNFSLEMEINYWIEYKMCDFLMKVDGENVGVSVTRACPYPFNIEYTLERARDLLHRKLYGLVVARDCVSPEYCFLNSILHIWCINTIAAEKIREVLYEIRSSELALNPGDRTYGDVRVICTVCPERIIYTNRK